MTISQSTTCNRLSVLGLDQKQVHSILNQVDTWISSSGPEWTVSRLKSLKQRFISLRAGVDCVDDAWISVDNQGFAKGAFRPLFRHVFSHDVKKFGRALNALLVYTSMTRNGPPTALQWAKFQGSAERLSPAGTVPGPGRMSLDLPSLSRRPKGLSYVGFPWSSSRRAPAGERTVVETNHRPQIESFFRSEVNHALFNRYGPLYHEVMGDGFRPPVTYFRAVMGKPILDSVGRVSFIQEPGYKLRAIANPYRIHQLALEPLKQSLLGMLRQIPEDCTFAQDDGVRFAKEALDAGEIVHSVDLSDATNNFPLSYTMELLRSLDVMGDSSHKRDLDLFEELSTGPWTVRDPTTGTDRIFSWTVGQPLGLGPSFAAFALSHHSVLRDCMEFAEGDYRILGDDIIIVGDELSEAYRSRLAELGVPVSPSKTLSSSKLAEFAGKVITPEGVVPTVKWRQISDRNFLDYTKFFGPQFVGALRPRQRKLVKAIREVPDFFGGLGFNPKGKPVDQRIEENWWFIKDHQFVLQDPLSAQASYRETSLSMRELAELGFVTLRFNYFSSLLDGASQPPDRPDQVLLGGERSVQQIAQSLGIRRGVFPPSVAQDLGLSPSVRVTGDPRGPSQLDILEKRYRDALVDDEVSDSLQP